MAESKERDNHKYVARVKVKRASGNSKKNQYRYFYTQPEYQAYLKNNKVNKEDVEFFNKSKTTNDKKSTFLDKIKTVGKNIQKYIESGKEAVSKILDNVITDSGPRRVDTNKEKEEKKSIIDKIFTTRTTITNLNTKDLEKETKDDSEAKMKKNESYDDYVKRLKKDAGTEQEEKTSETKKNESYDDYVEQLKENNVTDQKKERVEDLKDWMETIKKAHDRFPSLPLKAERGTDDEDQLAINPNYDPSSRKWSENCAYCTAAYEMRQRGYDVEADSVGVLATAFDPNTEKEMLSWYKDPVDRKITDINKNNEKQIIDNVKQELLEQGDGARGNISMRYRETGGKHSMAYEVTNGEVIIRDCQVNEKFSLDAVVMVSDEVHYYRTDNLELTDKILKAVKKRK